MPIKPENRARYPKDWKAIRARILERAGHCCEFCGVPNYQLGAWFTNGWHVAEANDRKVEPLHGGFFPCRLGEGVIWTKVRRIVLTIAHLDHTPENNETENLKALCQRCHLRYDAKHHATNAARTWRAKNPTPDMLDARGLS